jgi:DNA ligase D-like protein (predicted polymerase)
VAKEEDVEILDVGGREVRVTHPGKLYFTKQAQLSKLDLVRYYLAVAGGALGGIRDRPIVLKRFVNGAEGEAFYQKRAPDKRPAWLRTVTLSFPSGRTAEEVVVDDAAGLGWIVNLGCIELHPHAVRAADLDHPDELRVDLDPGPGVVWDDVRRVALEVKALMEEVGLRGFVKTSGSRGMHINARINPRWSFTEVRRAALALSREVERRAPAIATSAWWKEERHGVFLDYNQNARDRTTCSVYSVRATPDARVSMPLAWDDFLSCDPRDFTLRTVPAIYADRGDPHAAIDANPGRLDALLELADRQPPEEGDEPKAKKAKKLPVITIAQAKLKPDALAGLERWKARHPDVAAKLAPEDILVDTNRGRATAWYRVRINLKNIPVAEHPPAEDPDPNYDPRTEWAGVTG